MKINPVQFLCLHLNLAGKEFLLKPKAIKKKEKGLFSPFLLYYFCNTSFFNILSPLPAISQ